MAFIPPIDCHLVAERCEGYARPSQQSGPLQTSVGAMGQREAAIGEVTGCPLCPTILSWLPHVCVFRYCRLQGVLCVRLCCRGYHMCVCLDTVVYSAAGVYKARVGKVFDISPLGSMRLPKGSIIV